MNIARAGAALLAAAILALAACGGDDRDEAEQTVKSFVSATNEREGEGFCRELVTQEFLEQNTGATGERAAEVCQRQLEAIQGLEVKLVKIRSTEIDGDRARVTAVLETQGRRHVQVLRLQKEDGDWKLTGGAEAD